MSNVSMLDQIRAATVGAKATLRKDVVTINGVDIEVRQPTQGARSELIEKCTTADGKIKNDLFMYQTIVALCYVPGTDERVFTQSDLDGFKGQPSGDSFLDKLFEAIMKVMGTDTEAAEKN